jgi:hypothetical protein
MLTGQIFNIIPSFQSSLPIRVRVESFVEWHTFTSRDERTTNMKQSKIIFLLCALIFLLLPQTAGAQYIIADHTSADLTLIPDGALSSAANLRVMLRRASVGGNISDGLNALQGSNAKYNRSRWDFQDRGNPGWEAKLTDFTNQVAAQQANFDLLSMKFCFIDPDAVATAYINEMNILEAAYPTKIFVWWTIPIETSGNTNRQLFNNSVRAYASTNGKILFDIADIESYNAAGVKLVDGSGRELQQGVWSSDGGHLNDAGSRRVASAWWWLMARVAGWDAAPQNLVVADSSSYTISIKWWKNRGADFLRYRIYQGTSPNPTIKVDSTIRGITDTSKTFTGLTNGTKYYFRLTAVDSVGNESGYSNEVNAVPDVPLPVELSKFIVSLERSNAELRWKTETEVNNYGFEIERRTVNSQQLTVNSWEKIGFVVGAGTSNSPHEYTYSDQKLSAGRYIYRLKQIDNDATFEYSKSIEVQVGAMPDEFTVSQNYPNPFNPTTTIEFTLAQDSKVLLKVYNVLGQEVATLFDGEMQAGILHRIPFNASRLSSGIYFYRLEAKGNVQVKKLVLMK